MSDSEDEARPVSAARIAELRRIFGHTQIGLARRAGVSVSLLRKVEGGTRAASPSFIAAIARALGLSVIDITTQPYFSRNPTPDSEQAGVPLLRQALVEGDDMELDTSVRSIGDLEQAVAQIKELDRRTNHAQAVRELPDVLRHLHRARLDVPARQQARVHEILAEAYSYSTIALYRLGHLDLSHLADERAKVMAAKGDDPLRLAIAEWNHALILLFDGSYSPGLRAIDRAFALTSINPSKSATTSIRGALHLRAAVLAARQTNRDLADDHLREAGGLSDLRQEGANVYGTKFDPTNVSIHRVAIPVELADGTTAVSRAKDIRLSRNTAPSRSGHYYIDLSRAWLLHGDRRKAIEALNDARRIAPQLTRYHPQVHETVSAIAHQDRVTTDSLSEFARWCGIRLPKWRS